MEIRCKRCGTETLFRREARFEGFTKTGEDWVCTSCGHRRPVDGGARDGASGKKPAWLDAADADTPSVADLFGDAQPEPKPQVFSTADLPDRPQVFDERERRRSCGWCRHRVVNPFAQHCGLHEREVEATDLCDAFEPLN